MLRSQRLTLCVLLMAMLIVSACTSHEDPIPDNTLEDLIAYHALPVGQLAPAGCETYIGAHPIYPGELL